jgi:hypothetical protein
MPSYPNRPAMERTAEVWRHLSLDAVVQTIRDRKLRLTRLDTFRDVFEGSVPKQQIEDQLPLFAGANFTRMMMTQVAAHYPGMQVPTLVSEDSWTRMTRLRRAKTRSVHASCWASGHESEALWRLYCGEDGGPGLGVALRSTLARLEAAVSSHDLFVSPVVYRPYHLGPAFTHELDSFFHKRQGFWAESEVRVLKVDDAQYGGLIQVPPAVPELPIHLHLDVVPSDLIEEIVLSPYADEAYEAHARAAIAAADPAVSNRVILSVLNPRRYAPGF